MTPRLYGTYFGVTMLYRIARAGIFKLDAEKAHDLAIQNFKRFTGTPLDLFYRQKLASKPVWCWQAIVRSNTL